MIIDAHTHIGNMMDFKLSITKLIDIANKQKINKLLISSIDASEVDHNQDIIKDNIKSQVEINSNLLKIINDNDNLAMLVWCKPLTEGFNKDFEEFLVNNLDKIKGLKFHPFHSKLKMTSKKIKPYLDFANKYKLPVLVHCAYDKCSRSKYVYQVAQKYPRVNFVMAHLELGGNYKYVSKYVLKLPNLYTDTAWLNPKVVIDLINSGAQNKIIFGSDAPIDDDSHYSFYSAYFSKEFKNKISVKNYNLLMYKNAKKVYKI